MGDEVLLFCKRRFRSNATNWFLGEICEHLWESGKSGYTYTSSVFIHLLYLCQSDFSTLVNIKTKFRSKLDREADLRCALSATKSRINLRSNYILPTDES